MQDSEVGCCGMAEAFGYEKEHSAFSRQIAAKNLLPRLAEAPTETWVIANGFSCRHLISDLSYKRPLHVSKVLSVFLAKFQQKESY